MATSSFTSGIRHSWLGFWTHVPAGERLVVNRVNSAPCVLYMGAGDIAGHWVRPDGDRPEHGTDGDIRFESVDHERQLFHGYSRRGCQFFSLVVPMADADAIAVSEGVDSLARLRHVIVRDDPELQWCMQRLASRQPIDESIAGLADEASRRLILRLVQLSGGRAPDWHDDGSRFDGRTVGQLVEHIDANLKIEPCLTDMSMRFGLSPSHFAKKFRLSTGLSLHRFVTRRRILASFESLKEESQSLAHVALDLGFSSQSHFTRIFSDLTGMTPAKYRKQVRRTVG